jgi:hypothetical protein
LGSERLTPSLLQHEFCDRNHNCLFSRKSGQFVFIFDLRVFAKTGWFFAKPLVGLGCPIINTAYNQILQPADRTPARGFTFGFGISNDYADRGDYSIESFGDILAAAADAKIDFEEIALPYYERHNDLEAVEKSLNPRTPDGAYIPTTVPAACKGLIAAWLCERKDFEALADFYYQSICKVQRRELATPILTVKNHYLGNEDRGKSGLPLARLKG